MGDYMTVEAIADSSSLRLARKLNCRKLWGSHRLDGQWNSKPQKGSVSTVCFQTFAALQCAQSIADSQNHPPVPSPVSFNHQTIFLKPAPRVLVYESNIGQNLEKGRRSNTSAVACIGRTNKGFMMRKRCELRMLNNKAKRAVLNLPEYFQKRKEEK